MEAFLKSRELLSDFCVIEPGVFASMPCIDLLSAEIACEQPILNEVSRRGVLKDAPYCF